MTVQFQKLKSTAQAHPLIGVARFLLDLLYPPRCIECGRVDAHWCASCQASFAQLPRAMPTSAAPPPLQAVAATSAHVGRLQTLVHALKYQNGAQLAPRLAQRLVAVYRQQNWQASAVAAVPLHTARLRQRGYNQSQLLASQVADMLALPDISAALQRDTFKRAQVGLNRAERQQNVAGAFRASATAPHLNGGHILLIDDVFTTGATLAACGDALIAGGALAVYGLTLTAAVKLN